MRNRRFYGTYSQSVPCRDRPPQQAALRRKLQRHDAYYGIAGNAHALARVLHDVRPRWRKWLQHRFWRTRMTWATFARCVSAVGSADGVLSTVSIVAQRLRSWRSRMPEPGTWSATHPVGGFRPDQDAFSVTATWIPDFTWKS